MGVGRRRILLMPMNRIPKDTNNPKGKLGDYNKRKPKIGLAPSASLYSSGAPKAGSQEQRMNAARRDATRGMNRSIDPEPRREARVPGNTTRNDRGPQPYREGPRSPVRSKMMDDETVYRNNPDPVEESDYQVARREQERFLNSAQAVTDAEFEDRMNRIFEQDRGPTGLSEADTLRRGQFLTEAERQAEEEYAYNQQRIDAVRGRNPATLDEPNRVPATSTDPEFGRRIMRNMVPDQKPVYRNPAFRNRYAFPGQQD